MKRRPRIYYSAAQKALMWDRWKAGDTLHEIGKLFDRPHTSIHTILSATGGIRPPQRHRSRLALSMAEREEISRALAAGESIRCIAKRLKRSASPVTGQEIYVGLDYGQVRGPVSEWLAGQHLAGAVIGMRGGFSKLSYDFFIGKPISKPQKFSTASITAGFNLFLSF